VQHQRHRLAARALSVDPGAHGLAAGQPDRQIGFHALRRGESSGFGRAGRWAR